jgi:cold shock CspA family protein
MISGKIVAIDAEKSAVTIAPVSGGEGQVVVMMGDASIEKAGEAVTLDTLAEGNMVTAECEAGQNGELVAQNVKVE